ncbi:hypothetical protein [Celeribacter sp. PS-C1]|uniref:hypothetical protein n=1 Tax=Celeribacter sp. PS-C1 TaxID=2820813 RepID=UPI001CA5AB5F|nr:hypothetical protein [Celeribacter sp. PS-C1]MBW6419635.1 hypothetical protein [Celeribacter sp. PS-C1]
MAIDWTDIQKQAIATLQKWYAPHQLASVENINGLKTAMKIVIGKLSRETGLDAAGIYADCEACLPALLEQSAQCDFKADLACWRQELINPAEDMTDPYDVARKYQAHLFDEIGQSVTAQLCLSMSQLIALAAASASPGDEQAVVAEEGRKSTARSDVGKTITGDRARGAGVWLSPLGGASKTGLKNVLERRDIFGALFGDMIEQCKKAFVPLERATDGDLVGIQFLFKQELDPDFLEMVEEPVRGLNAVYVKADGLHFEPFRRGLTDELDMLADMFSGSLGIRENVFYTAGALSAFEGQEANMILSCFRDFSIIAQDYGDWFDASASEGAPLCLLLNSRDQGTEGLEEAVMDVIRCLDERSDGQLREAMEEFAA